MPCNRRGRLAAAIVAALVFASACGGGGSDEGAERSTTDTTTSTTVARPSVIAKPLTGPMARTHRRIEPAKVTKSALQNAVSVAGTMLTTRVMVTELKDKEKPVADAIS